MHSIDKVVLRETKYIAITTGVLSIVLQIVFVACGSWDYTVLSGNLLSAAAAVFNFLWMGITVQKAVLKEEKDARTAMRASQAIRTLCLFVILAVLVLLDCFNTIASIVPLFFPRIAVTVRPLFEKRVVSE